MAKANITQYSSTPSSNTDINNINIDENCPASGLNNAIRELMAHLKNVDTGSQALTALSVTGDTTISSGNLLVGKTAESGNTAGHFFSSSGYQRSTRNGGIHIMNRITTDGSIIDFQRDGSAVGSIDSRGGVALTINSQSGNGRLSQGGTTYYEWNTTRFAPVTDTVGDLGRGANRWKDLYLSGGAYLGGTGSANHLDDYEEGTWTPSFSGLSNTPTYHVLSGRYTKVGRFVMVQFSMQTNASPTFSDNNAELQITGLPFAIESVGYVSAVGAVASQGFSFNGSNNSAGTTGQVVSTATTNEHITFKVVSSGNSRADVRNVGVTGGAIIETTLCYTAT